MTAENQAKPTDVDKAFLRTATYRSLGEQQLSPQEERFEKGRRTVGLLLAPLATIVFLLLPLDIDDEQQTLAAVLLGVIVLWITEPVPIPVGGLHRHRRHRAARRRAGRRGARRRSARPPSSRSSARSSSPRRCSSTGSRNGSRSDPQRCPAWASRLPGDHRVRRDHLRAVGVRLQHRHGRDAAADRHRHPHRDRQADAGPRRSCGGLRPAAAPGRRRADADARLRRQRRRAADAGGPPAQPDRSRADRGGDRREDRVPRLDDHGASRSAR